MRAAVRVFVVVSILGGAATYALRDELREKAVARRLSVIKQVSGENPAPAARQLSDSETTFLTRAWSSGRIEPLSDGSVYVTDQDKRIHIPSATGDELSRLTKVLDLTEFEQRRVKSLLEAFADAGVILDHYREPLRTVKRYELQRQFRLSMYTALPKHKESAADRYLEQPR